MAAAGKALLKRAWNDVPEAVIGIGGLCFGLALMANTYRNEVKRGYDGHKYKYQYTVKRRSDVCNPNHPGFN